MNLSPATLVPKLRATISSPLQLTPALWMRPDDGVYTGGCRTLTAGDKSCFQIADASQTGLDPLASDFSVCGWINPSSIAAGTAVEIAKGNEAATDVGWCIYRSTANLIFRCGDGSDTVSVTLGTMTAGAWHFFAVTVDRDGNATGYMNNVANGSPQAMAAIGSMNSSDAFSIGASSAQANHAGASFASIAVANRLWTVAELTYMFNLKNNKVYAELGIAGTDGAALLTNLISYWNCNETDPTSGLVDQHSTNDLTRTAAELVTNGTFTSNINGWTNRAGAPWDTFEYSSDKLHMASNGDGSPSYCLGYQQLALTSGNQYTRAYDLTRTSGTLYFGYHTNDTGATAAGFIAENIADASVTATAFTATASNGYLIFSGANSAACDWLADNVSVKSAAIAVGNGPSEAIASDSVGTAHGTFSGVSAAGLITNWIPRGTTGYAFYFDGTDDTLLCGNLGNVTRITFDVKSAVSDQELMTLANSTATAIKVSGGTLSFGASLSASNITVDGVSKTAAQAGALINDGTWHTVAFDLTSVAASNVKLATDSSAYGNITLDNVSFLLSGAATHTYSLDDGPFGNPGEGDPVWGWESLEGSRYLTNQSTAANRPVHRLTGINSLPAEEFDGANDFLRLAGTAPFTSVDAWTAAVVIQPDVVNVNQAVLGYADEGSANNFLWFGVDSTGVATVQGKVGTNAFSVKGNTALSASTKCLLAITFDGTNYQLRVNGKAQTETRSGTEGSFSDLANVDSWTLGALLSNSTTVGSNPFNGLITEPAIYASEITPSRLAALELYYSRRYGITLTP